MMLLLVVAPGGGGGVAKRRIKDNGAPKLQRSISLLEKLAVDNGMSVESFKTKHLDSPLYIDIGLSDGKDTKFYLSKGYSTVSVDAYAPWIDKAKEDYKDEIDQGRALFFNVGLSTEDQDAMKLYFKQAGSVTASFDPSKGCSNIGPSNPRCHHVEVPVIRCGALFYYIGRAASIAKVDIEMLHHSCIRELKYLPTSILPKTVCWEEHDKPFGSAKILRPITDTKLILLLFELGYDQVKLVLQGPRAHTYYKVSAEEAGGGGQSGNLTPDEMMHYRSDEKTENEGNFDTDWRSVAHVLQEGVFSSPRNNRNIRFNYFDVCMKLGADAEERREIMGRHENFPLFTSDEDK